MKPKNSKSTDLCPYRLDWPWRVVVLLARGLGVILETITFGVIPRRPNPFTIGLTVFLAFESVVIIATALQGTLLPNPSIKYPLLDTPLAIVIIVLIPLGTAVAFRFYEQLFPTLEKLNRQGVISLEANEFKSFEDRIESRCNSLRLAIIFLIISLIVFWAWAWLPWLIGVKEERGLGYIDMLPTPIIIYLAIWIIMYFYSLLFFVRKAKVLWNAIRKLSTQTEKGLGFSVNLDDPDEVGGFSPLSALWLNVNYMAVFVGIVIFGTMIRWHAWVEPLFWFVVPAYIFLAPLLFFGPFMQLHSLMTNVKQSELEKRRRAWDNATTDQENEEQRKLYADAQSLPTWPFDLKTRRLFWVTYIIPFLVPVFNRILRLVWPET